MSTSTQQKIQQTSDINAKIRSALEENNYLHEHSTIPLETYFTIMSHIRKNSGLQNIDELTSSQIIETRTIKVLQDIYGQDVINDIISDALEIKRQKIQDNTNDKAVLEHYAELKQEADELISNNEKLQQNNDDLSKKIHENDLKYQQQIQKLKDDHEATLKDLKDKFGNLENKIEEMIDLAKNSDSKNKKSEEDSANNKDENNNEINKNNEGFFQGIKSYMSKINFNMGTLSGKINIGFLVGILFSIIYMIRIILCAPRRHNTGSKKSIKSRHRQ